MVTDSVYPAAQKHGPINLSASFERYPSMCISGGDSQPFPQSPGSAAEHPAEAARYAILMRIAPKLHHDLVGALQPIGMIAMVLQRRVKASEPDMQAIVKNVVSVDALVKEAAASCLNAIGWLMPSDEVKSGLRGAVEEVLRMLAIELSAAGLIRVTSVDGAPEAGAPVSKTLQDFLRTVLAAALLAYCDEPFGNGSVGSQLDIEIESNDQVSRIVLRRTPDPAVLIEAPRQPPVRRIGWADVDALAASFGVSVTRRDGCVWLELPATQQR